MVLKRVALPMFLLVLLLLAATAFIPSGSPQASPPQQIESTEQLLVWTAPALQQGEHTATEPGQLAFIQNDGSLIPLIDVPDQSNRIMFCGTGAISSDQRHGIIFMGLDTTIGGSLYMMTDGNPPTAFENDYLGRGYGFNFLGCQGGNSRLNFNADNTQLIYTAYERNAKQSVFSDGYMRIINVADLTDVYVQDNVVATAFNEDFLVFVRFFTDDRLKADEAAVFVRRADGSEREVTTFIRETEACEYSSAYANIDPNGQIWLILGEKCGEAEWQLYRINPDSGETVLMRTENPRGGIKVFVESNNLWFSPNGDYVFYTLADGVTNESMAIYGAPIDDLSNPITIVERNARFISYSEGKYGGENTFPQFSRDGKWMGVAINPPTEENFVAIISLEDPNTPPILASAGSRGDTISYMEFTPDSSKVYFIAGGSNPGDDNSIFVVDVAQGAQPQRVIRGKFNWAARISPDGTRLAVQEWQVQPEGILGPDFLNLVVIGLTDGSRTTLFEGAQVANGQVGEVSFAYPMWWRSSN